MPTIQRRKHTTEQTLCKTFRFRVAEHTTKAEGLKELLVFQPEDGF
jgi:hypothetical protein